jgi:recombination protein RecT
MNKAQERTQQAIQRSTGEVGVVKNFVNMDSKKIESALNNYKAQISQLLPRHISPQKFISVAVTLIAKNESLKKCSSRSLLGALLQASALGLDLTQQLGQASLVPYKNSKTGEFEAEFQIGYRGMVSLMKDGSEEFSHIEAFVVYEDDQFSIDLGLNPNIIHKPNLNGKRDKLIAVYGVISYKNGIKRFDYMTKEEIMKVRAKSKSKDSTFSPWNDPQSEPEMWKKTLIKRMSKVEKMPTEKLYAIQTDEAVIPMSAIVAPGEVDLDQIEPSYTEIKSEIRPIPESKPDLSQEEPEPQPERPVETPIQGGEDVLGNGGGIFDLEDMQILAGLRSYCKVKGMSLDSICKFHLKKSVDQLSPDEIKKLEVVTKEEGKKIK